MELRRHNITLENDRIRLRPMTEDDWVLMLAWNNDPEALYLVEGGDVESYSLARVQKTYRMVSQTAFCFIIEHGDQPIGECWLQKMDGAFLKEEYRNLDNRRIALMIGEKNLRGHGLGAEIIGLLTQFAFESENCDQSLAVIPKDNIASIKAFEKAGYQRGEKIVDPSAFPSGRFCILFVERLKK